MPDLTIVYYQKCTKTSGTDLVASSKGVEIYQVVASLDESIDNCTCPGFMYRRKCRHIVELRSKLCSWDEAHSQIVQTPQQEMEATCPCCGSETETYRAGV